MYVQLLLPAYYTTLGWEKNNSSTAHVIPQVLLLIQYWNKVEVSDNEAKELCYFLIHFVRIKFKYPKRKFLKDLGSFPLQDLA
jgi:hypothetical protein